MKIFNLENPTKGKPLDKQECVAIATWEEWALIHLAVTEYISAHPKAKKIKALDKQLELMAIY